MENNVVAFPKFTKYGPNPHSAFGQRERLRLAKLFAGKGVREMRALWDEYDGLNEPGGFCGEDIHAYMNMLGDGSYCAV